MNEHLHSLVNRSGGITSTPDSGALNIMFESSDLQTFVNLLLGQCVIELQRKVNETNELTLPSYFNAGVVSGLAVAQQIIQTQIDEMV